MQIFVWIFTWELALKGEKGDHRLGSLDLIPPFACFLLRVPDGGGGSGGGVSLDKARNACGIQRPLQLSKWKKTQWANEEAYQEIDNGAHSKGSSAYLDIRVKIEPDTSTD